MRTIKFEHERVRNNRFDRCGGCILPAFFGLILSDLLCSSVASAQEPVLPPVRIQFDPFADPTSAPTEMSPAPVPGANVVSAPREEIPLRDPAPQAPGGNLAFSSIGGGVDLAPAVENWTWQTVPDGVIYPSYLAGVKEPRMGTVCNYIKGTGWTWDSALGARLGLLRYGTEGSGRPDGCELGVEGAAFPRLDLENDRILESVDFRFGVPLSFGLGPYQTKVAYYHSCSHLGDQYMLLFPGLVRTNYTRDAVVWGNSDYPTDDLRVYVEMSWGFHTWGAARPWEFVLGAEYSPTMAAGSLYGSPFAAVNEDLRQDVDYSGNFVAQAGWQWRSRTGHLFRIGAQYFTGKSEQFQLLNRYEEKIGVGIWYDF